MAKLLHLIISKLSSNYMQIAMGDNRGWSSCCPSRPAEAVCLGSPQAGSNANRHKSSPLPVIPSETIQKQRTGALVAPGSPGRPRPPRDDGGATPERSARGGLSTSTIRPRIFLKGRRTTFP